MTYVLCTEFTDFYLVNWLTNYCFSSSRVRPPDALLLLCVYVALFLHINIHANLFFLNHWRFFHLVCTSLPLLQVEEASGLVQQQNANARQYNAKSLCWIALLWTVGFSDKKSSSLYICYMVL